MRVGRKARVPVSDKIRALDAVLFPVLAYRAPSWAPSGQLLAMADALQRRCAALAVDVRPFPMEDGAAYRWRRGCVAATAFVHSRSWVSRILEVSHAMVVKLRAEPEHQPAWAGAMLRIHEAA